MDISTCVIVFIVVGIICVVIKVLCVIICRNRTTELAPRNERRVIQRIQIDPTTNTSTIVQDRQGNTLADESARDNRYNDIFFIEPNSVEAARIRAQLEKDDKDLPSYEEVMRMKNLTTTTTAANFVPATTASVHFLGASSSSVNTTDTTLTVPSSIEANPNISSTSRPLTPPPYTSELSSTASVILPITTPMHSTQTQTS